MAENRNEAYAIPEALLSLYIPAVATMSHSFASLGRERASLLLKMQTLGFFGVLIFAFVAVAKINASASSLVDDSRRYRMIADSRRRETSPMSYRRSMDDESRRREASRFRDSREARFRETRDVDDEQRRRVADDASRARRRDARDSRAMVSSLDRSFPAYDTIPSKESLLLQIREDQRRDIRSAERRLFTSRYEVKEDNVNT